jgi:TetR/AcrR family transcriptional repressor of nem operon
MNQQRPAADDGRTVPPAIAKVRTMARPKAFDEECALEAAIECFWKNGYTATSVRDLSERMGICGTSLYNAYGGKRALFERALEHYLDRTMRARIKRLETTLSPKQAIRTFLEEIIDRTLKDSDRRGCFLVNSALEIAPHDSDFGAMIAARLGEIEAFFRRSLERAIAAGEVPRARDPQDIARLLLGVLLGIRVLARSRPERALLEGVARPALALLD